MSENYEDDRTIDYDAIRRRVNRRILRWGTLGVSGVLWVIGSGIVSMFNAKAGQIVAVLWFGVLGLHAVVLALLETRDRMLQHEIERETRRVYGDTPRASAKAKRGERLALSDDGELVEVNADDWDADETSARR